jgi:hypothetical protein
MEFYVVKYLQKYPTFDKAILFSPFLYNVEQQQGSQQNLYLILCIMVLTNEPLEMDMLNVL